MKMKIDENILARFDFNAEPPTQADIERWREEAGRLIARQKKRGFWGGFVWVVSCLAVIAFITPEKLFNSCSPWFLFVLSCCFTALFLFVLSISSTAGPKQIIEELSELSKRDDSDRIVLIAELSETDPEVGLYFKKVLKQDRLPVLAEWEKVKEIQKEKKVAAARVGLVKIKNLETV